MFNKLIQVPIDFLVGIAVYFVATWLAAPSIVATCAGIIAGALFAEFIGLKMK